MSQHILDNIFLERINPKHTTVLLSAARSEYLTTQSYDGRLMTMVSEFFSCIASELYGTTFVWSEYNKEQWTRFVNLCVGIEGGACVFSMENSGILPELPSLKSDFKGLLLGTPAGMFPYSIEPIGNKNLVPELLRIIKDKAQYSICTITDGPAAGRKLWMEC